MGRQYDEKELKDPRKSMNINEEYLSALRTKSYADFFTKVQVLVNEPSSTPCYHDHTFSEVLLEPAQDTIAAILDASTLPKKPDLKSLMLKYFDVSAEASKICSHLLKGINQIQSNYRFIQQAVEKIDHYSPDKLGLIFSELSSFIVLNNPFSNPNKSDFKLINEEYSSILYNLKSKRKKVARKIKLIKYIKKASGVCVTAACSMVAITAMVLAAHTLTAILMGPAIFSFPLKRLKKKVVNFKCFRSGLLRKAGEQLDAAAKGAYTLNRDFDTMSRLVVRLHDEIEHNKAMIQFCLERRKDKFSLQEVVKELKKNDIGFRNQVEELEEHVYLCLVTINRARALVIKEVTKTSCIEELAQ
ncbi:hypothetical protein L1049_025659 [Liquidambar formosana]|uniref:Uncharacterized protein n=1 Tax=Liquidambar formosana TaxID=63359 RepID=A0AAP0NBP5_LIQFO